ncbi:hypothetical protein [Sphingomonas sp.]|uniref:hypothetical protein n=1 Tax=Sphingomonas sp. TaxID=28214 RepID=UPI003AFF6B7D
MTGNASSCAELLAYALDKNLGVKVRVSREPTLAVELRIVLDGEPCTWCEPIGGQDVAAAIDRVSLTAMRVVDSLIAADRRRARRAA